MIRELPKVLLRCCRVSFACLFLDCVVAEMQKFAVNPDPGNPLAVITLPANPFVAAGSARSLARIGEVLTMSAWPNIATPIIQSVMVPVVVHFGGRQPGTDSDLPVHFNKSIVTLGVPEWSRLPILLVGVPAPLHGPFVINIVNDGDFSLGQGYSFHSVVSKWFGFVCSTGPSHFHFNRLPNQGKL